MNNDYRPLTREEQLEYQINFLKQQKKALEELLKQREKEYQSLRRVKNG